MLEGFSLEMIDVNGISIRTRRAGSGPPLLLMHGNPQTHVMWHKVAPKLADHFTVVATDLRGYCDSSKPPTSSVTGHSLPTGHYIAEEAPEDTAQALIAFFKEQ